MNELIAKLKKLIDKARGRTHNVSDILNSFHTVVAKLETAVEVHSAAAKAQATAAELALQAKAKAEGEIESAKAAVQNIRALIRR
jgi:ABC-type transporter Mla subunit MlaD